MTNTLVSITMCTYNGAKYIDEQIRSILEQDYPHFELIIIDDCSTDDTFQKLQSWAAQSPKIKLFQNSSNLGYNKNFAKAIGLASGDYISIADQDDIWMKDKTSKLVAAFQQPGVVLAHGMSVMLKNGVPDFKKRKLHYHFSGNDTRRFLFFNHIMGHDMMFTKELLPFIFPIPDRMFYDWWIAIIATIHGQIASVKEVLVHHRIHETNSYFNKSKEARKKELDIDETLTHVSAIPNLPVETRSFLDEFLPLVKEQSKEEVSFNRPLFRFFVKHRKIFFGHKRRKFPIFSYIKNAYKFSKKSFRGRGGSL